MIKKSALDLIGNFWRSPVVVPIGVSIEDRNRVFVITSVAIVNLDSEIKV
jgi:hypothetical protein